MADRAPAASLVLALQLDMGVESMAKNHGSIANKFFSNAAQQARLLGCLHLEELCKKLAREAHELT